LFEKSTSLYVGNCGFHTWCPEHYRAEIGYDMIDDMHKNKGYMTEALCTIIAYGFNEMKLNRIEALIGPNNIPSLKLLQKFGFTKEGYLREHYCKNGEIQDSIFYALLKSEYVG
jgi:ribosomal-protein-alanine N-acetyltransferase